MTDLMEFLLARIAEDEAAVATEAVARISAGTVVLGPAYDNHPDREAIRERLQESLVEVHRKHPWSSPWSPARVLAECEAKRRIIKTQAGMWSLREDLPPHLVPTEATWLGDEVTVTLAGRPRSRIPMTAAEFRRRFLAPSAPSQVLRLLALPYADHPQYKKRWAPS